MLDEEILKQLEAADVERAKAYANDLERGLKIVRTFPQGVTIFGSARLPQDNKYCKKARELGQLLAQNGHAVITGGGPGIMEAANHGAFETVVVASVSILPLDTSNFRTLISPILCNSNISLRAKLCLRCLPKSMLCSRVV